MLSTWVCQHHQTMKHFCDELFSKLSHALCGSHTHLKISWQGSTGSTCSDWYHLTQIQILHKMYFLFRPLEEKLSFYFRNLRCPLIITGILDTLVLQEGMYLIWDNLTQTLLQDVVNMETRNSNYDNKLVYP